jgi:hypothetical protein
MDINKFNKLNVKLEESKLKEQILSEYYKTTGHGFTKYHLIQEKCRKLQNQIENLDNHKTLTELELNYIIFNNSEPIDTTLSPEEIIQYNYIKEKLKKHTYDNKRLNVFTGKKADNLQAYLKYDDDIE